MDGGFDYMSTGISRFVVEIKNNPNPFLKGNKFGLFARGTLALALRAVTRTGLVCISACGRN